METMIYKTKLTMEIKNNFHLSNHFFTANLETKMTPLPNGIQYIEIILAIKFIQGE